MIHITENQKVAENENLVVLSPTGDYADTDLILCGGNGNEPAVMLAAQFIQYGGIVYKFNAPEELGAALVAIDPTSTHDSATLWKEEEARRLAREKGTLEPENPVPAPDAIIEPVAEEVESTTPLSEEPPFATENAPLIEVPEEVTAPEEVVIPTVLDENISPATILEEMNMSSTTPALDISTTTPE